MMSVVLLIRTSRALCATLYKNNNIARDHGRNNIARQARGNTNSRFHIFLHLVDFYMILVQSICAQNDSKYSIAAFAGCTDFAVEHNMVVNVAD